MSPLPYAKSSFTHRTSRYNVQYWAQLGSDFGWCGNFRRNLLLSRSSSRCGGIAAFDRSRDDASPDRFGTNSASFE
jgi:hypothetical protein